MPNSANAILALSRAYYGKRLRTADYDDLLECKSLAEFAAALKTKSDYDDVFSGTFGAEISSKVLTALCEKHRFDRFMTLCRFELAIGNQFYQYFITRTEIDQILGCTLLLFGGRNEEYLLRMHPFLDKHLSIDLYALARANSLEEVARALDATGYGKLYRSCLYAENSSYLTFEQAFEAHFTSVVKKLVKKCFSGAEEKALHDLICRSLDCKRIETILRTLKYYRGDLLLESLISPALTSMTLFTEAQLRQFAACEDEAQFRRLLKRTPYGDWLSQSSGDSPEFQLQTHLIALCRKQIRFSVHPGVVMFCYLLLAQNENNNLVRIIEGIKFNVPASVIRAHLILTQDDENGR